MLLDYRRTDLPADTSPPPAPGVPDQPAEADQPGQSGEPPDGTLPGLPRLFFADPPAPSRPDAGPSGQSGQDSQLDDPGENGRFPGRVQQQPATSQDPFAGQGQFGAPPPGPGQEGWRPPAQRGIRPRPQPPSRELRQRAIASLVLSMLALVALLGLGTDLHRGIWALVFSAIIGIGAAVVGITALVKARRTGSSRPGGAVGGVILGVIAAFISVPILVTYLAFPGPVNTYVKCLGQAQTSGQQQACAQHFYKSIHLSGLSGADRVLQPATRSGQR